MASVEVKPNVYKSNIKWSIRGKNVVDTVHVSVLNNSPSKTAIIYTEAFKNAEINGTTYALPISSSIPSEFRRCVSNKYYAHLATREFAKARIECHMATGRKVVTLDKPVTGTVLAKVQLSGKSYELLRGEGNYNYYPTIDEMSDVNFNLCEWIKGHAQKTHDVLTWNYEGTTFSMNPFVRNWVSMYGERLEFRYPTNYDILTTWWTETTRAQANETGWLDTANFGNGAVQKQMFPVDAIRADAVERLNSIITLYDKQLQISASAKKLDDYKVEISWSVPVRMCYAAASRSHGILMSYVDTDNWAFVDEVDSIQISIEGSTLGNEYIDMGYAWRGDELINTDLPNVHPLKLGSSELLTYDTTHEANKLYYLLPTDLLNRYRDGKYAVEMDVNAEWAIRNAIHVDTEINVYLPNGQPIKRGDTVCTFLVKNIEKRYTGRDFVFSLKLIEK